MQDEKQTPPAMPQTGICRQCGGPIYARGVCLWCAQPGLLPMEEISLCYQMAAKPLRRQMQQLRRQLSREQNPERIFQLKRRLEELRPILTQLNELEQLTAHYYDRGYWRSEKYTL